MKNLNLLGVSLGGGRSDVPFIDPHSLGGRVFEIDAKDNSGLYSALDPAVLANNGDLVLAWQDVGSTGLKSPNQATSGFRGIARQASFGWGVEFGGVDDRYAIDDSGIAGSVFASCTIYSVLTLDSLVSSTVLSSSTNSAWQDRYGNPVILKNDVTGLGSATSAPSTGVRFVDCVTYNGTTLNFYRNGAANGTVAAAQVFATSSNRLGATSSGFEFFDGLIHNRTVFSTVHDAPTRDGIMAYLMDRWEI